MILLLSLALTVLPTDTLPEASKDTVHAINRAEVFTGVDKFNFRVKDFDLNRRNRLMLQPRIAPVAGFFIHYKWLMFAYSKSLLFAKDERNNPVKATNVGASYLGDRWGVISSIRRYKGLELIEGRNANRTVYPALTYLQASADIYRVMGKNRFSVKNAFGYNTGQVKQGRAFLSFLHIDSQQWNDVPVIKQDSIYVPEAPPGHYRYITNIIPEAAFACNRVFGKKGLNGAVLLHTGVGASLVAGKGALPAWGCAWDVGTIAQFGINGPKWYGYLLGKDDYLNHTQSKARLLNNNLQSIFLVLGLRF